MKYALTISGDSMAEVYGRMRAELERAGAIGPAPAPGQLPAFDRADAERAQGAALYEPAVPAPADADPPTCPNGHGAMQYRAAGTIRSGPRIGQSYPAFYSCRICKATFDA